MKRLFILFVLCLGLQIAFAQNCSQFINAVNGKKLVYVNLDSKGNPMGKIAITTTKKDGSTVAVHTEVIDKKGKTGGGSDSEMSCNGQSISVDMKSFIPTASLKQFGKMDMKVDGHSLVYPLELKAGQKLADGTASVSISNNGADFGNITITITNRKVATQENVSTSAGSFNCFRINYDLTVRMVMMGMNIPINMHVMEWFSPKLYRMVKSETYSDEGKGGSKTQLESIN